MKNLSCSASLIFLALLISCENKPENKEAQQPSVVPATSLFPPVPLSTTDSNNKVNTTLPEALNNTNTAGTNLNPEHGKPGHRCDIAVGAPLTDAATVNNSQPNTPVPVTIPSPNVNVNPANPPATAVAPGMNPQHGQPGHRCDIAVGAPLDSKPKQ